MRSIYLLVVLSVVTGINCFGRYPRYCCFNAENAAACGLTQEDCARFRPLKGRKMNRTYRQLNELGFEDVTVLDDLPDIREIIREKALTELQESSLYICDMNDLIEKYYNFTTFMPRVIPHYAVKCNNKPNMVKMLAALGTGFDCASKAEMEQVLDMGVDPSRIVFANTIKSRPHIEYARAHNIDKMTFDNDFELYKIHEMYPDARLILRISADCKMVLHPLTKKFGCDPDTEALPLAKLAMDLGMKLIGVSFHVGSGCGEPDAYVRSILKAKDIFDFCAKHGNPLHLLDLGGGFQGEKGSYIEEASRIINPIIDKHFPNAVIIAEPGRYFALSAFTLAARIIGKKKCVGSAEFDRMYYISDGAHGSYNLLASRSIVANPEPLDMPVGPYKTYKSVIWGPTCDSSDQIKKGDIDYQFPDLDVGSIIIDKWMGAYSLTVTTRFNGFEHPKVAYFIKRSNLYDMDPSNIWKLKFDF